MIDQNNFFEVVRSIPGRAMWLIWKLISFQGVVFVTATVLTYFGKLDSYIWLISAVLILFGRSSLDIIREIKR